VGLDWRAALSIVLRIAEALHHAHSQGVVHRDLKPANIMLLPSGEPKILDFGIAKVETARTRLTTDGQFFGTPLYMSPEQAQGKDLGPRSDLFSLGAVAYNLLTGHAAFAGESIPAIMHRVIEEEPLPPSQYVAGLPDGVDAILSRTLAKDPALRYPDGESLADDLKEVLGGRAPHERAMAALPPGLFARLDPEPESSPSEPPADPPTLYPAGLATRPGGDLEEELDTLVSGLVPLPDLDASAPTLANPRGSTGGAPTALRTPRWLLILPVALGAGLAALGVAAYVLWPSLGPPKASAPSVRPSVSPEPPPPSVTAPEAPLAQDATVPARSSSLAIDFEYPLKDGRLRVWIDGKLSLNQDLAGRASRKLVGIKFHQGSLEKTLTVPPGRHEVRVRVSWEDNVKEETLAATFKAGATRVLEIRLGRIRKNLSLEWK
jgi:serine/threonine protein kinase